MLNAQQLQEAFQPIPFGSIKPTGWIKEQMQKDLDGFVGHLDAIVPDLINDPIYSTGRLQKHSKAKDLGNQKAGDAAGDEQYKWWNSETQSNWWDGYIRNVLLLQDSKGLEKVRNYVNAMLKTQDIDGYLGIYDRELRYSFQSENGELWAKASVLRGLMAYYEFTKEKEVFQAIEKAVNNVMVNYPIHRSSPFESGKEFNGGVSHGLTFTDVLERMYFHTKDEKYRKYAAFLYENYSNTHQSEADAQLKHILDQNYKLKSHGVHTYEHLRALIIARYASARPDLTKALEVYHNRIQQCITISGGAIGDEWIAERTADATHTGYEYCSLHELLDSYCMLLQKEGNSAIGDQIETLFYNAAQGSRHPEHSCIAYLKTDNSFEMLGTKNGETEPNRKQTRYKYSPAHQDVAVCCNPNAGRITPYFIQNAWMKENENTLVALLLMPNELETQVNGNSLKISNITNYPYENSFLFKISQAKSSNLKLKIRKPAWAKDIVTREKFILEKNFIVIERNFAANDQIELIFEASIEIKTDPNQAHYFTLGSLLYALPIESNEIQGKIYSGQFQDFTYAPVRLNKYQYNKNAQPTLKNGKIQVKLENQNTNKLEEVELIPMGKTILRQVTF